jgi:hypothetical protein
MTRSTWRLATICLGAGLAAGCTTTTSTNPFQPPAGPPSLVSGMQRLAADNQAIPTPALIGVTRRGVLKYYAMGSHGSGRPHVIARVAHLHGASSMAANGDDLGIVRQNPAGVVRYNVKTQAETTLSDPNGTPIDIAIDKRANLFVLNIAGSSGNVTMYRANSSKPVELNCQYIGLGEAIAADNEGNIFVNGYDQSFTGVVEIPNGPHGPQPQKCKRLALQPENGYVAGLAVDPKTDDLIVLDDPDLCAGGEEGRMTIYPKPYRASTGHFVDLNGNCVGQMRLDATSSTVFAFDQTVSGAISYIIQRSYPDGRDMGTYRNGDLSGITTIPNTLPN